VQLVNLRVTASGRQPALRLAQPGRAEAARRREREVWFARGGLARCPVLWRDGLLPGEAVAGPCVVEALDSTFVLPPGWTARVDQDGYLRVTRS